MYNSLLKQVSTKYEYAYLRNGLKVFANAIIDSVNTDTSSIGYVKINLNEDIAKILKELGFTFLEHFNDSYCMVMFNKLNQELLGLAVVYKLPNSLRPHVDYFDAYVNESHNYCCYYSVTEQQFAVVQGIVRGQFSMGVLHKYNFRNERNNFILSDLEQARLVVEHNKFLMETSKEFCFEEEDT